MKQTYSLMFNIIVTLSLVGCQSNQTNTETEPPQEQGTQSQERISEPEQETSTETASDSADSQTQQDTDNNPFAPTVSEKDETGESANLSTTHTMEELTTMVSDFEEKVNTAVPSGSAADDIEQFLAFKQEEKSFQLLLL